MTFIIKENRTERQVSYGLLNRELLFYIKAKKNYFCEKEEYGNTR